MWCRAIAIVVLLASAARADEFGDSVETRHPEWIERSAKTIDARKKSTKETRRYDAAGKLITYTSEDDRRTIIDVYPWDANGRVATYEQSSDSRVELSEFSYRTDTRGRVVARGARVPAHTVTFLRGPWT